MIKLVKLIGTWDFQGELHGTTNYVTPRISTDEHLLSEFKRVIANSVGIPQEKITWTIEE